MTTETEQPTPADPPADFERPTKCPNCGGEDFSDDAVAAKRSNIPDGRLQMHDIHVAIVTGCDNCSETICIRTFEDFLEQEYVERSGMELMAAIIKQSSDDLQHTNNLIAENERASKVEWAEAFVTLFFAVEHADPIPRALMHTADTLSWRHESALELLRKEHT